MQNEENIKDTEKIETLKQEYERLTEKQKNKGNSIKEEERDK